MRLRDVLAVVLGELDPESVWPNFNSFAVISSASRTQAIDFA